MVHVTAFIAQFRKSTKHRRSTHSYKYTRLRGLRLRALFMACLLSELITNAQQFNYRLVIDNNVILLLSDKLDEFIESSFELNFKK